MGTGPVRLAVVISHPIQHHVHLFRALAKDPRFQLRVFFCTQIGVKAYHDREMDKEIIWSGDLLAGYAHEFLVEGDAVQRFTFWSINNPSVSARLAEFKPEAVFLSGYNYMTTLRALSWCRRRGVATMMMSDGAGGQARSGWKTSLRKIVVARLLDLYGGFLTVGDRNDAFYAEFGVGKARRFRAAFPIDEVSHRAALAYKTTSMQSIRERHGLTADTFVYLAVGKLSPRKRTSDMIAAIAQLSRKTALKRPVHLLICGDGAERDRLAAQIAEQAAPATLVGFVNLDQLPNYMAASDVMVHAAEIENFGLVCAEAALMELPLIVSDVVGAVGPTSVARPGSNALIFPCRDIDALEAAMFRLLTDATLYRSMSIASRAAFGDNDMRTCIAGLRLAISVLTGRHMAQVEGETSQTSVVSVMTHGR
jgi:glycosyltransferase involved in cell wall biosynthesis